MLSDVISKTYEDLRGKPRTGTGGRRLKKKNDARKIIHSH